MKKSMYMKLKSYVPDPPKKTENALNVSVDLEDTYLTEDQKQKVYQHFNKWERIVPKMKTALGMLYHKLPDMPNLCHLLKRLPMNIFLIICKCVLVNLFYTSTV